MFWGKVACVIVCVLCINVVAGENHKNTTPLIKLEQLSQKVVINVEQMDLNKLLNVIRDNTDSNLILAPEFSSATNLKKVVALPTGVITLRELLDTICIQIEGKWMATGKNGDIIVNPLQNTIVAESDRLEPVEPLYTVEYAGKTLRKVLKDLHKKSGAQIIMYGNVGSMKIEMIIGDATIKKILKHLAFLYDLRLSYTSEGVYRIGKE